MDKYSALKQYYGYDSFRPGQEFVIDTILSGRDILAVMPTGAGKSLCFQIPTLITEGTGIVISPLISLMKDQITALQQQGIEAETINSSMTAAETDRIYRKAAAGRIKLLYVAPERLENRWFLSLCEKLEVPFVFVDEAHCVSQWGQDFRPSYLKIPEFIKRLRKRPVTAAFTATATEKVRKDIINLLEINNPDYFVTGFDRENLRFEVVKPKSRFALLTAYLNLYFYRSVIIYCATRKTVDKLYDKLTEKGYALAKYHAGLENRERQEAQKAFSLDKVKIIVATNAFGMGIDKPDVALVIHYNMPGDPESYYQEAGRAGRDGEKAECILFYSGADIKTQQFFIDNAAENEELTEKQKKELRKWKMEKLGRMIDYTRSETCLRARMLRYFGEKPAFKSCGNCSVCAGEMKTFSVTVPAQMALSALRRAGENINAGELAGLLKGNPENGELKKIKTCGVMKALPLEVIKGYIALFARSGLITVRKEGLKVTEKGEDVLFGRKELKSGFIGLKNDLEDKKEAYTAESEDFDPVLFEKLRQLRKSAADMQGVPPFVIFSDKTLREMAARKPSNPAEMMRVPGVGDYKMKKYGHAFLKEIAAHGA